ncbi:hypothetical protein [Aquimarina pacifica]|uniref:hypothetical protein n=1 Tax=Aquimarina pacifica TaxID=1296415 RepID=UPI0004711429|nr:hypothetical protein [Aquimarina pacifica]
MPKIYSILLIIPSFFIIASCSNNDDQDSEYSVTGTFVHQIPDCDNSSNFEINCSEFVEFVNSSEVNALIGGSDIIYVTTYTINKNSIELSKEDGLNFDISFTIQDNSTLIRKEDDTVWLKKD